MKHILQFLLYISLLTSLALAFSPTPNPHPVIEITCDNAYIPTKAYNISKKITKHKIVFFQPKAESSIPNIAINPHSVQLINEDNIPVSSIQQEDIGRWRILKDTGEIYFTPEKDFNGTTSIKYTINNNCDYPQNRSNIATITLKMIAPTQTLPTIDGVCSMYMEKGKANNDKHIMHSGEKLRVINVLNNDNTGIETSNHFVNASLRLISPDSKAVRRVHSDNQGTWIANTNTGQVFFIPEKNFTGEANISYVADSPCSYNASTSSSSDTKSRAYQADITIIAPTPTPTPKPCPETKEPVCGQEKLCEVDYSGETNCLSSIPHNTTYANMCELFNAGDVFLYEGACKKPTPTPTPKVIYLYITPTPTPVATPATTPKPTVVTPKEETKPKPPTTTPTDTNTSASISKVKSSNGSTLGLWSILIMMLLTVMLVIMDKKRKNA